MIDSICKEMHLQKDYLPTNALDSIYFGGGTPSLLNQQELDKILSTIDALWSIKKDAEITLEANPDDLNTQKLEFLAHAPINRLSIGIQSFSQDDLDFMNRAHNAKEALEVLTKAQAFGFEQISVDLIYGGPTTSDDTWKKNINKVISFNIPHISCYALTVEPNTALAHFIKKGKCPPLDEEKAARQFNILIEKLSKNGYEQYEISNFSLPNSHAKHNTSYWQGKPYLGVGPSANSYNKTSRQWNVSNNAKYMSSIQKGLVPFEREELSDKDIYNETVMTALRTKWGLNRQVLKNMGKEYEAHFLKKVIPFLENETVMRQGDHYLLTTKGKFLADGIAAALFF